MSMEAASESSRISKDNRILTHSIFGVITNLLDERPKCSIEDIIFSLCTYHLKALNIDYTAENVNKHIKKVINSNYKELLK